MADSAKIIGRYMKLTGFFCHYHEWDFSLVAMSCGLRAARPYISRNLFFATKLCVKRIKKIARLFLLRAIHHS